MLEIRRKAHRFAASAALIVVLGLATAGCGSDARHEAADRKPLVTSLVADARGSDAFISINSYRNGDLVAYVCDGSDGVTLNGHGRGRNGAVELISKGGAKLTGRLTEGRATGTFTPRKGKPADFIARPPEGRAIADRMADCRRICT